ncbi:MAG: methyltransferase domain-containing protein [Tepidiformaceae bacterium]
MAISDVLPFFRAWVADPRRVAAMTPSSPVLARLVVSEVSADSGPVLELGPGTGAITEALLARGVRECDLTLLELSAGFASMLERRYPEARVVCADAARLHRLKLFGNERAGAAVSGLPLLAMSPRQVFAVLAGAFEHLRADGAFYQFTYGPRCPVPAAILDRLGLNYVRIGGVRWNLPPASVYRIERRRPSALAAD